MESPMHSSRTRSQASHAEPSKSDNNNRRSSPSSSSQRPSSPCLSPDSACDLNKVHEELEKLNIATDVINKLEMQLDEGRNAFRDIQSSWSNKLEQLIKKLGGCIERSRPYYEARLKVHITCCFCDREFFWNNVKSEFVGT